MKIIKILTYKQHINTRNKHQLHRPNTTTSSFQKSILYAGIIIFNSLSESLTVLKNEKLKFKVILRKYLTAHSTSSVEYVLIYKDDI